LDPRVYVKISRVLKDEIRAGTPGAGEPLRVAAIAAEQETTRDTVHKALKQLRDNGYVIYYSGKGWYVTPSERWQQ
jgi:DNA-binding GntR family transcriptional regulator